MKKSYIPDIGLFTFVIFLMYLLTNFLGTYCGDYLKEVFKIGQKIYLVETSISLQNIDDLICHGRVLSERSNSNAIYVTTNRRLYYLATQIFLVLLAYLFTVFFKVSIFRFAYFMLLTALSLQLLFNLNFGLNIFNQIFLNTYLFCILFKLIYDKK